MITYWNPAAERIFGHCSTDVLGQTLDIITPTQHQKRHWDGYAKTMQSGQTRYGHTVLRVPALHKDGHTISIAFTITLLHSATHEITGIAALIRDETAQFMQIKGLKQRIIELEKNATT